MDLHARGVPEALVTASAAVGPGQAGRITRDRESGTEAGSAYGAGLADGQRTVDIDMLRLTPDADDQSPSYGATQATCSRTAVNQSSDSSRVKGSSSAMSSSRWNSPPQ